MAGRRHRLALMSGAFDRTAATTQKRSLIELGQRCDVRFVSLDSMLAAFLTLAVTGMFSEMTPDITTTN